MENKNYDSVWCFGDIHGNFDGLLIELNENTLTNSAIFILGDCGVGFNVPGIIEKEEENLNKLNDYLKEKNNFLYFIRGNHDNPNYWKNKNILKDLQERLSNIIFLEDNKIIKINEKDIFVFGGAISIDRFLRREGRDYWEKEEISRLMQDQLPKKVDYILSHTSIKPNFLDNFNYIAERDSVLKQDLEKEQKYLRMIFDNIKFDKWICGHYHLSLSNYFGNRLVKYLNEFESYKLI